MIVGVYALLVTAWIVLSDRALAVLVPDPAVAAPLQTWKGLLYVLISSLVLWMMIRRTVARYADAERRAARSEEHIRLLMDLAPVGILVVSTDGVITYANQAAARIAGVGPSALLGVHVRDQRWRLEHPDGRALSPDELPIVRALRSGQPAVHQRLSAVRPDGARVHLEVWMAPPADAAGGELICVVSDITVQTEMEAVLLRERTAMHQMFDFIPACFLSAYPDGTVHDVNETFLQLFGWRREEVLGRDVISLLAPADEQPRLRALFAEALAGTPKHALEIRAVTRDGRERILEWNGSLIHRPDGSVEYLFGFGVDVSACRAAEARRQQYAAQLENILTHMTDGFIAVDAAGTITEFNAGAERLLKKSRADAVGRELQRVFPELADTELVRRVLRAVSGSEPVEFETWIAPQPYTGWYGARIVPPHAGRGACLFFREITQQKRQQDALRTLSAEMESRVQARTAQLESVNRELESFGHAVSHDLRAPLRAIDGFSRILLADHADRLDDDGRYVLHTIIQSVKRLNDMLENLVSFSRVGSRELRLATVDMRRLIDDAIGEVRARYPERTVAVNVGDLPAVVADRALLQQVFVHLLDNAFKFTAPVEHARVDIGARTENGMHVFTVTDTGIGFDPRFAGKLFGVFQRLHPIGEYGGTGIGLAVVKRIVHRHGGWVRAHGEPNRGATFTVALPVRDGEEVRA